jgi:hypothetical protein
MDAFWFIPMVILGTALVWGFYAHIKKQSLPSSVPNVLVDKPSDGTEIDESAKARDWEARPCGSFLDHLYGRD